MKIANIFLLVVLVFDGLAMNARAEEANYTYRVEGLFQKDREADLRATIKTLEGIELVQVDYRQGHSTFRFDAEKLYPNAKKPEQILQQFDQRLRQASRGTFQVTALSDIDRKKLTEVKIAVAGLDCKGCSYGAYLAVTKVEGVENAISSFHDGYVIAWIDAEKTNREALEAALEKRKVKIVRAEEAPSQP